jgi:uncharacterized protein YcbK (DUF882 family)
MADMWADLHFFTPDEFLCPCCGRGKHEMNPRFLGLLDLARRDVGIPFHVTSGYRCPEHNAEIGGVASSAHVRGYAADIACGGSRSRAGMIMEFLVRGVSRIGIGKDFIHVDIDPEKPRNVFWVY